MKMMGGVKLGGFKSVIAIKKLSNKPPTENLNSTVILNVQAYLGWMNENTLPKQARKGRVYKFSLQFLKQTKGWGVNYSGKCIYFYQLNTKYINICSANHSKNM